ncbi:MAG: hypothetical protein RBR09_00385 [Desulfobulbaceae bacterium]|jgi:protocatechuate 3,4-dioxygenase beta subunit|nr:hypothetical protein [Desulfobulbaceae bacterium]
MRTVLFVLTLLVWTCFSSPAAEPLQAGPALTRTPPDQEGPFYPVVRQHDEDNDLVNVAGRPQPAAGNILHLTGRVRTLDGEPVAGAVVEIWQTDPHGRYNDERDGSPGPRDPNFQYQGKATTGEDGSYSFLTLVPGGYLPRPPHIHFKVFVGNTVRLTSQIYFRNHPQAGETARFRTDELLTVDLQSVQPGEFKAVFDIVL